MNETKDFPTEVIASLSSGISLCEFAKMHEAAEFLMGHQIWTHHFASKDLWSEMQKTVVEQCPGMPTSFEGVNKNNYKDKIAELHLEFGPTMKIRKGGGLTALLPTDGIPAHLKENVVEIQI